jgi:hypothetical protein
MHVSARSNGSHFPCPSFLLHGWIVLSALIWILLDLTQLRHTQLVGQCDWGHAPSGMSALHERAPYWPMEESVAPSMPGRCWLVSSDTQNRTELSQTLRNLCTWYSVVTTYPFVTSVVAGTQEWPLGRTQPVLIDCRWSHGWYYKITWNLWITGNSL